MNKHITIQRLECTNKDINNINNNQIAYLTDTDQIVYRTSKGEFKYFDAVPELLKAIDESNYRVVKERYE